MEAMYAPQNNGPHTVLAKAINSVETSVTVQDSSVLPTAPNVLTLGTDEDAELVLLENVTGNILTVQRGFGGTVAKEWNDETWVYRAITAQDISALQKRAARAEVYQRDLTAEELSAMTADKRAEMYADGTRMIRTTNGNTVVMLMLEEDGKTRWAGGERPQNLLGNSNFANPVNQRGQASYTAQGYAIDRWRISDSGGTLAVADGHISITRQSDSGGFGIDQQLPDGLCDVGAEVTMAVCDHDSGLVYCASGVIPATPASDIVDICRADFNGHAIRLKRDTSGNVLYSIRAAAGDTLRVRWAALYVGAYTNETIPPYSPKEYAVELSDCMRYYQVVDGVVVPGVLLTSGTNLVLQPYLPVPMRVSPTLEIQRISWLRGDGKNITSLGTYTINVHHQSTVTPSYQLSLGAALSITTIQTVMVYMAYTLSAEM